MLNRLATILRYTGGMKHWQVTRGARELSPRPLAPGTNRRRRERVALTLLGRMQTLHGTRTVRLHDLSPWGAMVEGVPPSTSVGSEAIFKSHALDVFATVLWLRGDRCGIRFDAPIRDTDIEALQAMSEQLSGEGQGGEV
jgi:hypothetical protein